MGTWNHTFWDNDDCLAVLHLFFVHLGLMNSKTKHKVGMCVIPGCEAMGVLVTQSESETVARLQQLFYSVTKEQVTSAIEKDPNFESKFRQDMQLTLSDVFPRLGVSLNTFWVLLRMHCGVQVELKELQEAAVDFEHRAARCLSPPPQGMMDRARPGTHGWNMAPNLEMFIHFRMTPSQLETQRNKDAKIIRQGILQYKHDQPMRLPFLGFDLSGAMWMGRTKTTLPLKSLWNLDLRKTTGMALVLVDPLITLPHCMTCNKKEAALRDGAGEPLKKCPCGFARYCNAQCQKMHWRDHRLLHQIRVEGIDAARRSEKERIQREQVKAQQRK